MRFLKHDDVFVIRMEEGEDIVSALNAFCADQGITGAGVHGIGAVKEATLGYYSLNRQEYVKRDFRGEFEIVNLSGNVTVTDGKPFVHVHAALAGRDETGEVEDFRATGGHLFQGTVSVTAEIIITRTGAAIPRKRLPGAAFGLMDLPERFDAR